VRKATLASILRKSRHGVRLNEHLEHDCGLTVFQHACKMGLEGIVSKRLGSRYKPFLVQWLGYRVIDVRDAICSSSDEGHDALSLPSALTEHIEVADAAVIMERWES
jgi:hypothetical protein